MNPAKSVFLAALLAVGLGCGYSSKPTTPATPGTMPAVTALVPSSTPAGSNGVVLTVNGSNFNSGASINWNGVALSGATRVSGNQLMVTLPNADVASAGTAAVSVTNPAMGGGIYGGGTSAETSNSMTFTIN